MLFFLLKVVWLIKMNMILLVCKRKSYIKDVFGYVKWFDVLLWLILIFKEYDSIEYY